MEYKNYSISSKEGKFYLKSKTPLEGYSEVRYGMNQEKVTYHQYHSTIVGKPAYFGPKEVIFEGRTLKFLELTLIDGDISNKVSVPLKNTRGGYTDEARTIISTLYNADLNEPITLTAKLNQYKNKKGEDKHSLALYGNYINIEEDGRNKSTGFIPYSDIPALEQKTVAGEKVWDSTAQTEFFFEKLTELQQRFRGNSTSAPSEATDDPSDDLPF